MKKFGIMVLLTGLALAYCADLADARPRRLRVRRVVVVPAAPAIVIGR